MDGKIVITKEMLDNARDYVPIVEKEEFIRDCCNLCFDLLSIEAGGAEEALIIPPRYKVNQFLLERYLVGAFLRLYFGVEYEKEQNSKSTELERKWLMTEKDFDIVSGSHIFNQLERCKKEFSEYKNKIFDIISDYKKFERKFVAEVNALSETKNDVLTRFLISVQLSTTPEHMEEVEEKLKQVKEEFENSKSVSPFLN